MRKLIGLLVLLAASRAHAMGVYITFHIVAWNSDGSSVLLERDQSSSGTVGHSHAYVLASVTDKPRFYWDRDSLDPDVATEKITPAMCKQTGADLAKALAADKFTGVNVVDCSVTVTAAVATTATTSIVASPTSGSTAEAAVKLVDYDTANAPSQAALTSGKLVLVLYGDNGDSSTPAHVQVLVPTAKGGFVDQGDLRD